MKQYLETGKIVSVHGIKGEVRVQPWCDDIDFLTDFDVFYINEGKDTIEIEKSRVNKNVVIMKISGVDTVEEAQKLRNTVIYIDRDDVELEEGSYFVQDLLGLTVIDYDNNDIVYGKITDVTKTGANDVYHIKGDDGKLRLIPAIPDVVKETNLDKGIMIIKPLEGLFDDED